MFTKIVGIANKLHTVIFTGGGTLSPDLVIHLIHYAVVVPQALSEWGKVIGVGVHIYICLWTKIFF